MTAPSVTAAGGEKPDNEEKSILKEIRDLLKIQIEKASKRAK
jgi:hypothetical protein